MSTPVQPSTPERKQATPSTPLTGTWRHPQLDEIARRQNATTFSEKNFKKVLWNVGTLVSLYFVEKAFISWFPSIYIKATKYLNPYSTYTYWSVVLVVLGNIILACLPLFRAKDDLSDIALTPAQRKLLGLPPSSAPPTPGSQYATPPRYQRTSTPLSGSPASQRSHSDSPLSGRGSPSGSISGIPFSPNASPMLQRAFGGGSNGARRSSYGSPSPLGPSSRSSIGELPGTPTPAASKGSSVGLNNRWLFEKGRRNSGSSRLYT